MSTVTIRFGLSGDRDNRHYTAEMVLDLDQAIATHPDSLRAAAARAYRLLEAALSGMDATEVASVAPHVKTDAIRSISDWSVFFVDSVNASWTKEIGEPCPVEMPAQLVTKWRLSGHLLKAAMQHGLIEPSLNVPTGERWKHLAPAWERHQDEIIAEARAYCRQLWKDAKAKAAKLAEPVYDEVDDGSPVEDSDVWPEGKE